MIKYETQIKKIRNLTNKAFVGDDLIAYAELYLTTTKLAESIKKLLDDEQFPLEQYEKTKRKSKS